MIEVDDQRLEDTTWTTIEYKNKSIFAQYITVAQRGIQLIFQICDLMD